MMFTVLVVDDSPTQLVAVSGILGKKEDIKEVLIAKNGLEALDTVKSHGNIDCVITDCNMPEMNGLDLIKELKSDKVYSKIPIVIYTSEIEKKELLYALELGASYYFLLPSDPRQIYEAVDTALAMGESEELSR